MSLPERWAERRRSRRLDSALNAAERRVRDHIDTQEVLRAAVAALHGTLDCRRTSAWLTAGKEAPRLAFAMGDLSLVVSPPRTVVSAAAQGRASSNQLIGDLALPLLAPRTGVMGVLHLERAHHPGLEGWLPEERTFAQDVAHETGLALQTACLYERALSEKEKSEAILARVADAVVVTDASGRILQWNPAAARIFGRPAEGALGGRCGTALGLHHGETLLQCSEGCPLIGMSITGALGAELWRERETATRQPLFGSAEAVRDADGRISEVVHSFRDITRLKEADEAKALFLATASHELKTPLTVIQGFAQTLLRNPAAEELRNDALKAIERRAIELDAIVNRLLLSSRIEAGSMQLDLQPIAIGGIVSERVDALASATGRAVHLETGEALPPVVGDPSAVAIILDHLLDNAIKYSPGGGPIDVVLRVADRVEIDVGDHGIGMDPEQISHCFDKFWQGQSSNDRRFGGTGIGLFIVRSLVEAMGGSVDVRSVAGRGTTFTVALHPAGNAGPETPPRTVLGRRAGVGEASVIREFMRQIGVPVWRER